ncbi:hypothetical protein GJ744_008586 [Endocarpon pusillum]|uniref:Major facilitator superfamily (MFS) profile domain-containing protein n=1 Tax=Endocarpon pusillum TaxID=364733 RepID=A0A8H7AJ45_9EURO|nr:hypothetical protein GJ744_008586 [Endocarpon pusillum]
MTVFMFILAAAFEVDNSSRTPIIILFTLLFCAIYSFTLGPAAYSLAAESFPSSVREAGMAISVFINSTFLGALLVVYPFVTAPIGYTASLCIFGCIDALAFIACFLFCVDTRDRTLDELQYSFDLPLSIHCAYRLFYVMPEAWKHYSKLVLRFFGKKDGTEDEEAGPSDSEVKWGLVPFHRWAWIEYISTSSRIRCSFNRR